MTPIDAAKKRILDRVPLAGLIGESMQLVSRSGRKVGLCPFHNEKSPSFTIYESHYFCFGCRAHGDAIDFVRHQKGLGFIETLRYLAEKFGIEVPELEESDRFSRQRQTNSTLFRVLTTAQDWFVQNLHGTSQGAAQRDYLLKRGFSAESIKDYGFGLTGPDQSGLFQAMRRLGITPQDLELVSLASHSQDGQRHFDFFRDRIMIPIRDPQGRIIAFGGRTTNDHPAKYLNSRENPFFDKSSTLYGFDRARQAIRQAGFAIVVEGYMDALMLWQSGFPNTVACLGTALTDLHLRLLSPATNRVVLLFDGDSAGQNASLRSVDTALTQPQMAVKVAVLQNGNDPDTFVRENGADALRQLIDKSIDILDFAITERVRTSSGLAITDLLRRDFLPWLRQIQDPIQRSFLSHRMAQLCGISQRDLETALAENVAPEPPRTPERVAAPEPAVGKPAKALTPVEYDLLAHVFFAQPKELDLDVIANFAKTELELDQRWGRLLAQLVKILESQQSPFNQADLQGQISVDSEIEGFLEKLRTTATAFQSTDRPVRVQKLIKRQKEARLRIALAELKSRLGRASAIDPRSDEIPELLTAIKSINKDISSVEKA